MSFTRKDRQRIIDGYLSSTGANQFVASDFVDWLEGQPDHEAFDWFFGEDDSVMARRQRVDMARRMASGLRIVSTVEVTQGRVIKVTEREYPAYLSPISGRSKGGGYDRFDPNSSESMAELRRQGAAALGQWLRRYRGAFEDMDLSALEEIASAEEVAHSSAPDRVAS